ncbi:MAG: cell division protein ZapA [Bdellovibrionales bacterium]|nr:cell division protein ZapA [Bdellovibrionales bacterium]
MASIETVIAGKKYVLSSEDTEEHLQEVAQMVAKKIAAIQKDRPSLGLQKASIIAAFDFASLLIKGKKQGQEYRSAILNRAHQMLEKFNSELSASS